MNYIIACLISLSLSVSWVFADDLDTLIRQSQKEIVDTTRITVSRSYEVSEPRFLNFLSIFQSLIKKKKINRIDYPLQLELRVYETEKDENGKYLHRYMVFPTRAIFYFPSLDKINTAKDLEKKITNFYEQILKDLKSKEFNKLFVKVVDINISRDAIRMAIWDTLQRLKSRGVIIKSCQSALQGCSIDELKNVNIEKRGENLLYGLIALEYAIHSGSEPRKYINIRFDSPGIGGSGYDFEDFYYKQDISMLDEKRAYERVIKVYSQVVSSGYQSEEERLKLVREFFDRVD